jgi:ssDNA-binding Zn-finger/Zn-ribbon topoisomerase 1
MFVVHEELLCSQSAYFHEKFQKDRKPIEGECPLCHDAMDLTRSELTFCRSRCGANMHYDCMMNWKEQKVARSEAITCPMCRETWPEEQTEQAFRSSAFDEKAFSCYYGWLYHRHIFFIANPKSDEDDEDERSMMKAYELSRQVRDKTFGKAVLQALCEWFQETEFWPSIDSIILAYKVTTKRSQLRKLIVDVFASQAEPQWFENFDKSEEDRYYLVEFLNDLAIALLRRRTISKDAKQEMENLMDEHCISEQDEEDDDEEEE